MLKKPLRTLLAAVTVAALLIPLPMGSGPTAWAAKKGTVRVAQQYGLWCALSTIVVQKKLIQKHAPGWDVKEFRFASGPDLRTALIAGRLDVGISGFAPFIKGWSKGAPTKTADIMTGYKHELVTRHTKVKNIHDFVKLAKSTPGFKIAAPAPGSSNHIALQWYLKRNGIDPRALDQYVIRMKHPTSYQSLITGQVDAHITSPPFAILAKQKGMKSLANLWPTAGGFMPNAHVVVNTDWAKKHPDAYQAVVKAFNEAAAWTVKNPDAAAKILAPTLKMSVDDTLQQMATEVRYDVSNVKVEQELLAYSAFMHGVGLIKRKPTKFSDFATPELVKKGY